MKKILSLTLLTIILYSCQKNEPFYRNKFYKGIMETTDSNITFPLYLTFINDTIAAFNIDSLKTCGWDFSAFSKLNDGLYMTDEHKIDTTWFMMKENNLVLKDPESESDMTFEEVDFSQSKKDSLYRQIEIAKGFSDKGIIFSCDFSIKEVANFYDQAVQEAKYKLKNPSSAKFIKAHIYKYWSDYSVTVVSLDVEAKNAFGLFIEDKYYVFFIPKKSDSTQYHIEFSESIILDYRKYEVLIE